MSVVRAASSWADENIPGFAFDVLESPSIGRARLGILRTPHGAVETPAFIFCATKGAMKATTMASVKLARTQFVLSNTYHLMLQPGADIVAAHGGLHKFTGWDGPFLTDSGGFQVFSLAHGGVAEEIKSARKFATARKSVLKIAEEGVSFRSHIDGHQVTLTPERSIEIQKLLGADIILTFDECTPFHVDRSYTEASLGLTHRWTTRALDHYRKPFNGYPAFGGAAGMQALYGISQGGIYEDLRAVSCEFLREQPCFGYAIGGSLGQSKSQMYEVVDFTARGLDSLKPIHLLGIGGIDDIFHCVRLGIDTFDCVAPTRMARHGSALTPAGSAATGGLSRHETRMNLRNAKFRSDLGPLDPTCGCHACAGFTRAYVHHMLKAGEILGQTLLTIHNITTMNRVMADIRTGIAAGDLSAARAFWLGQ